MVGIVALNDREGVEFDAVFFEDADAAQTRADEHVKRSQSLEEELTNVQETLQTVLTERDEFAKKAEDAKKEAVVISRPGASLQSLDHGERGAQPVGSSKGRAAVFVLLAVGGIALAYQFGMRRGQPSETPRVTGTEPDAVAPATSVTPSSLEKVVASVEKTALNEVA